MPGSGTRPGRLRKARRSLFVQCRVRSAAWSLRLDGRIPRVSAPYAMAAPVVAWSPDTARRRPVPHSRAAVSDGRLGGRSGIGTQWSPGRQAPPRTVLYGRLPTVREHRCRLELANGLQRHTSRSAICQVYKQSQWVTADQAVEAPAARRMPGRNGRSRSPAGRRPGRRPHPPARRAGSRG